MWTLITIPKVHFEAVSYGYFDILPYRHQISTDSKTLRLKFTVCSNKRWNLNYPINTIYSNRYHFQTRYYKQSSFDFEDRKFLIRWTEFQHFDLDKQLQTTAYYLLWKLHPDNFQLIKDSWHSMLKSLVKRWSAKHSFLHHSHQVLDILWKLTHQQHTSCYCNTWLLENWGNGGASNYLKFKRINYREWRGVPPTRPPVEYQNLIF